MNIIVKTPSGKFIVRPDTTWEKDSEDVFLPDFVTEVSFAPVLFARISKPGRSVGLTFAERYYDGVGFGVLLYPENLIDGSTEGFACASCLDHTSFLPFPVYNVLTLGYGDNSFELTRNGKTLFTFSGGERKMIDEAIAEATRSIYIRTGDIIAIELEPRKRLCTAEDGKTEIRSFWCGNESMQFNIIM